MFVGHLGVALGARRVAPEVPLWALVAATFALDLLWPLFLLAGLETVRIDPEATAFTPLDFVSYPWSHSLLMAIVWAVVLVLLLSRRVSRGRSRVVLGATVVSHWLLDFVTHRPDLPLWPEGPRTGLGLWHSIPLTLIVEGALFAVMVVLYQQRVPARDRVGQWSFWGLVIFTGAIWMSGPFGPPPPSVQAIAIVGLAMWLFPPWAWWIERHRAAVR